MSKKNKAAAVKRQDEIGAIIQDEATTTPQSPIKMAALVFGLPFVVLIVMALLMKQS